MGIRHIVSIKFLGVAAVVTVAVGFLSPSGTVTRGRLHPPSVGFVTSAHRHRRWSCSGSFDRSGLCMSTSDNAESAAAEMDTLISDLANAKDGEALIFRVSKSVKTVASPAFFLRLAELAERSPDPKHRVALEKLAGAVTAALEKLVEFAEEKMDDSASLLQIIVTSAAEKDGEFLVPLSEDRLLALRQSVKIHRDSLDNNFLATVQAWMEKSGKEGMEGMVTILQKVFQIYASEEIIFRQNPTTDSAAAASTGGVGFGGSTEEPEGGSGAAQLKAKTPANLLLQEILSCDEEKWDAMLGGLSTPGRGMTGGVTKDGLLGAIQVAVETVVLQEENGSMTQRVQAEFLSELCKRIEKACPEQQPGIP